MSSLSKDEYLMLASITREFALDDSPHHMTARQLNRLLRSRLIPRSRFNHDHHDTCMYIERSKNLNVVAYTANFVNAATKKPVKSGEGCNCVLKEGDPIHAYFINLEPSYIEARRQRGVEYDCDDLNFLERRLAYGCNVSIANLSSLVTGMGQTDEKINALPQEAAAALTSWWTALRPAIAHFVALSTWLGVILSLPPLAAAAEDENHHGEGSPQTEGPFADEDTVPVIVASIAGELSVLNKVYVKSIEPKHVFQLPSVEYIEVFGVSIATGKETYEKKTR